MNWEAIGAVGELAGALAVVHDVGLLGFTNSTIEHRSSSRCL